MHFWNNSAETNSALSNARHQGATGSWSLKVTPSSDPLHYPARVLNLLCTYDTVGTLNAVGKTYSAYVYVPNIAGTNYANTSCRLRAFDNNFNASSISGQQAITPGTWMHLQAVFSNSTVNQHIYEIAVDCSLEVDPKIRTSS
jgi:hypothetical protein